MPKLRASCDACGVAKVKCDRGQPTCGRCKLQGLSCVYGVCRRTGKPPGSSHVHKPSRSSSLVSEDWPLEEDMRTPLSPMFTSQLHSVPMLSTSASSSGSASLHTPSSYDQDLFGSYLHQSHPPLDLNDFTCTIDSGSLKPFTPAELASLSSYTSFPEEPQQFRPQPDGTDLFPPVLEPVDLPVSDEKHQTCIKEAYEILGEVAFIQSGKAGSPPSAPFSKVHQRPLDQILHTNKEAGERLHRLMTCSCAKSPGLSMVYASAIWRILQTYRQAAESVSSGKRHETPVSHAHISVGSFVIGDNRINIALSLQLLGDETRRIGSLTNLLATGGSPAMGAGDDMEQVLPKWLEKEYDKALGYIQGRSLCFAA